MANEKANDLVEALGEEGKLAGLTVKVTPEIKVYIADLRKRTGKGISEITQRALEAYFTDYVLMDTVDGDDDDE